MAKSYRALGSRQIGGGVNPLAMLQEQIAADADTQRRAASQPVADTEPRKGAPPWAFDPSAVTVVGPDNREDEALGRQLARQAAIRQESQAAGESLVRGREVDDALAATGGSTTMNRMTGEDSGLAAGERRARLDPMAVDARARARAIEDQNRTRGFQVEDRNAAIAEKGRERGAEADQNTKLAAAKVLSEAVATADPKVIQEAVAQIQAMFAHGGGPGAVMPADAPVGLRPVTNPAMTQRPSGMTNAEWGALKRQRRVEDAKIVPSSPAPFGW